MSAPIPEKASTPNHELQEALSNVSALENRGDDESFRKLLDQLDSRFWKVRKRAAEILARHDPQVVQRIQELLGTMSEHQRHWSLTIVAWVRGVEALPWLKTALVSRTATVRASALAAIAEIPGDEAVDLLMQGLEDDSWLNRYTAAEALERRGDMVLERLKRGFADGKGDIKLWSLQLLVRIFGRQAASFLTGCRAHDDPDIRHHAIRALGESDEDWAIHQLVASLGDPHWANRRVASQILVCKGKQAVKALVEELKTDNTDALYWVSQTLTKIGRIAELGEPGGITSEAGAAPPTASSQDEAKGLSTGTRYPVPLDEILVKAIDAGASDIHLKPGLPPIFRVEGVLHQTELPPLDKEHTQNLISTVLSDADFKTLITRKEIDTAYEIPDMSRFRVNCFSEINGLALVARVVPNRIPTLSQLELPRVFKSLCNTLHGIILICGPTGCGKSTTLAAMIDHINETREEHILTIEDPIEFRQPNKKCLITNRELGTNTLSFANALRSALREDPDIILIGELRDFQTMDLALTAAETGHLVLSTMHTGTSAEAIDRIINAYPPEQQPNARILLASVLKAVVCQMLVPTIDNRRTAVLDIMITNYAVANLIREKKMNQVDQIVVTGRKEGMQTRDDHLAELLKQGRISPATALEYSVNRQEFDMKLRRS